MIRAASRGVFAVVGDGQERRLSLVHVRDLVAGMVLARHRRRGRDVLHRLASGATRGPRCGRRWPTRSGGACGRSPSRRPRWGSPEPSPRASARVRGALPPLTRDKAEAARHAWVCSVEKSRGAAGLPADGRAGRGHGGDGRVGAERGVAVREGRAERPGPAADRVATVAEWSRTDARLMASSGTAGSAAPDAPRRPYRRHTTDDTLVRPMIRPFFWPFSRLPSRSASGADAPRPAGRARARRRARAAQAHGRPAGAHRRRRSALRRPDRPGRAVDRRLRDRGRADARAGRRPRPAGAASTGRRPGRMRPGRLRCPPRRRPGPRGGAAAAASRPGRAAGPTTRAAPPCAASARSLRRASARSASSAAGGPDHARPVCRAAAHASRRGRDAPRRCPDTRAAPARRRDARAP